MKVALKMSVRSKSIKRKAVENTALMAKKARGETDLPFNLKWTQAGKELKGLRPLIVLSSDSLPGRSKVAGFDIDFTVVKTASGRTFSTGSADWKWWDDVVPSKIKSLDSDNYRVVFFTNQSGIEKQKVSPTEIKDKIENIISQLAVPIQVFICTGTNNYRKPNTAMWDYFVKNCNGGVKVNLKQCFYVGDAAGRQKGWAPGKPKDFSCSDRMFAANIGIKFSTPDEFFLGKPAAPFEWGSFDPVAFLTKSRPSGKILYHKDAQEMIIMVGPPACGKTSFRKQFLEPFGYVAVNRDTVGTQAKCIKVARETLASGKSVVVDNTNPSRKSRKDFLDLAKHTGIPSRCFVMQTPLELAHHLNFVRQNMTEGQTRRIPDVAYAVYNKNFEKPSLDEGFSDIVKIDFVPHFENKKHEMLFNQWTGQ